MIRLITTILLSLCALADASAQSFTDNLQKQQGKGNVSVKQSSDIDKLVNGKKTKEQIKAEKKAAKEAKKRDKEAEKAARKANKQHPQSQFVPVKPVVVAPPKMPEIKIAPSKGPDLSHITRTKTKMVRRVKIGEDGKPVTRKVMKTVMYKGKKKVTGYRVQVFMGGNKREDKNAAEQIGHKVKAAFPDQPVYVHFYSPRWACRVGNFEKKEDAYSFLKEMKAAGFKQAAVVETKVVVRNAHVME